MVKHAGSSGMMVALVMLAGCATHVAQAPPTPPPPLVDTEAPVVVAETLPTPAATPPTAEPTVAAAPEVSPEQAAGPAAKTPQAAEDDDETRDPFNSQSVDNNVEGRHIIERALMLPQPD